MEYTTKASRLKCRIKKISILFTGVECSIRNTPKNAKVLVSQNF